MQADPACHLHRGRPGITSLSLGSWPEDTEAVGVPGARAYLSHTYLRPYPAPHLPRAYSVGRGSTLEPCRYVAWRERGPVVSRSHRALAPGYSPVGRSSDPGGERHRRRRGQRLVTTRRRRRLKRGSRGRCPQTPCRTRPPTATGGRCPRASWFHRRAESWGARDTNLARPKGRMRLRPWRRWSSYHREPDTARD
jgi:hypothetical protein